MPSDIHDFKNHYDQEKAAWVEPAHGCKVRTRPPCLRTTTRKAVVLDLVQPGVAARRLRRVGRQGGTKPRGRGMIAY